jgi:hypothetical protein
MPATISLTESATLAALRTVLLQIVPGGVEVVQGQVNRVAQPAGADFVVYTPILRTRLSTNVDTYDDEPLADPPVGLRLSRSPIQLTVQIDVHGPASGDNAQMISTVMRDEWATIAFGALTPDVQPLYADDPRQTPFTNGEDQIEFRWTIDCVLQANPIVSTPQDFADEVVVTPIEVDTTYPP